MDLKKYKLDRFNNTLKLVFITHGPFLEINVDRLL